MDVWAWGALIWILSRSDSAERRLLIVCVIVATTGELFLGFIWRLYEYRLGNLPLFIPPGHALVYAAGSRLKRFVPAFAPAAIGVALAPFCMAGMLRGFDTQGPYWYLLLIFFLTRQGDRRFYAGMFLLALAIESYGTCLGGWRYFAQDRWFGLRTVTSPPLWTGVFYCTLDALVVNLAVIRRFPVGLGIYRRGQRGVKNTCLTFLQSAQPGLTPWGWLGGETKDPTQWTGVLHYDHSSCALGPENRFQVPAQGPACRS